MRTDSFWKKVLEELFADFLKFFFPDIHKDIDFSKGYQFLDKEFQKISKEAKTGRKIVDKLVKVFLKDGQEKWLLIHIEVQAQREKEFAKRMFTYNYRIFDQYQKETISLALLTDLDTKYRPNEFRIKRWGFECLFKFPLIKIIDYIDYEFDKDKNPFSLLVRAFLATMETQGDDLSRYRWKREFILQMQKSGLSNETLFRIHKFIEWIMVLPDALDKQLYYEIKQLEEPEEMSVLTIAEKEGMKKGRKEGMERGRKEGIERGRKEGIERGRREGLKQGMEKGQVIGLQNAIEILMEAKFGKVEPAFRSKLTEINSSKKLKEILFELEKSVDFTGFRKHLAEKKLI